MEEQQILMNKNLGRFFLILIMALVFAGKSHAWQNNFENDKLRLEVWTENSQLHSSQPLDVILKFEMKNGWHILAENPGDIGRPTVVKLDLPEGLVLEDAPASERNVRIGTATVGNPEQAGKVTLELSNGSFFLQ